MAASAIDRRARSVPEDWIAPRGESLARAGGGGLRPKKLSRSENSGIFDIIRVIRIIDIVCGIGIWNRGLGGAGAVVAWRRPRAPGTNGGPGQGETGVECGEFGYASVDEIGG